MFTASLGNLEALQSSLGKPSQAYRTWEDVYRQQWRWDRVAWGTHCVDCYPGNCPFRVYVREGLIWREEQAGTYGTVEPGVPDMNPMGCQKGAMWSQMLYAKDRVLYPLKRARGRGEGKWKRISWDQALTEIADAVLDAIQEVGPESVIHESTPAEGGFMSGMLLGRLIALLGGLNTDVQAVINDFSPGLYLTFGKFNPVSSVDDWFQSELIYIWHRNPVYTAIPWYHFVAEARYKGAEVVTVAPDFNPSAVHADYHIPLRPGSDPAFALALCQVIISEGCYDRRFLQEQTDLPLLVRSDNQRFLRQKDLQESGRDDQFYFFDAGTQRIVEAPRGPLTLGELDPALEGEFQVTLKDGEVVKVKPVFERLKERLGEYTPERAASICGVHPEVIRRLARKTAAKRATMLTGWNAGKYYHGDLMERSMCLLLALTGNWGKKGTGIRSWTVGMFDGYFLFQQKTQPGPEETQRILATRNQMVNALKMQDPTMTDELAAVELARLMAAQAQDSVVPPAFFWYFHCGYKERWNRAEWHDPSMKRPFDEYMEEAITKGWWAGVARPTREVPPRVIFEVGGNFLRRNRGGQTLFLQNLWPQLKLFVTIDWRMNTTALYSDIFLPVAHHYEKVTFHIPTQHIMQLTMSEAATPPQGEAKPEWEIFCLLAKKIEERAKARNFLEYTDGRGIARRLDNLYQAYVLDEQFTDPERLADEWIRDCALAGTLPQGTTIDDFHQKGYVRFIDLGVAPYSLGQASDVRPDETFAPFRWHVEKGYPYPTLTRRAQFYIDHEWFLEAGEELPVYKENPKMGGDYPFVLTSGHPRWSIHSMNNTNPIILETHRGRPHLVMNPADAEARSLRDGDEARVFNDAGDFVVPVKLSPSVMPGQVICYNGWEPYMHRQWKDQANVEPGMIKWLHLAGGYGHLRYWPIQWQPVPIDRAVRVEVERLNGRKKL
jgi:DMSO reductase family type II enzyme molybdopterin subunit